jgi:hypothetical protein
MRSTKVSDGLSPSGGRHHFFSTVKRGRETLRNAREREITSMPPAMGSVSPAVKGWSMATVAEFSW